MVNINSNQKIFWKDIGTLGMANEIINNYHGKTIMVHVCKLYSSVINLRIGNWVEENTILHDEQNGF